MPLETGLKAKGKRDANLVASLIVLSVLYFCDKDYNGGRLFDELDSMRRAICQNVVSLSTLIRLAIYMGSFYFGCSRINAHRRRPSGSPRGCAYTSSFSCDELARLLGSADLSTLRAQGQPS
jgi:hypothetical protein